MQCVAASAQGCWWVTGAVGSDLFLASMAPKVWEFQRHNIKTAAREIPLSLPSFSIFQGMISIPKPAPKVHGRQVWDHTHVNGVFHHLLCKLFMKIKLGHWCFVLRASPWLNCINLHTIEHRKVNWCIGHHFVPQTFSKPIGSWWWLFTSSTIFFACE